MSLSEALLAFRSLHANYFLPSLIEFCCVYKGCSEDIGTPVVKVGALPVTNAHFIRPEPTVKDPSSDSPASPSKQGGGVYLSRYAIADAAARAAPAVVNVKVSFGKWSFSPLIQSFS